MPDLSRKSIVIIGTGSLACIFAARLSAVARVQILGTWNAQVQAINERGITVHELDGSKTCVSTSASCFPHQTVPHLADYIIVLVKSFQTSDAIERIKTCLMTETTILTLQNGLGNIEKLKDGLTNHYIGAGVTMQGANLNGTASVVHAGNGMTIVDDTSQVNELAKLINAAGIPVQNPNQSGVTSINEALWRKLIINSAVNPLTALLGQPNGYLVENKDAKNLCQATSIETAQIASLEGAWSDSNFDSAAMLTTNAARVTAANRSSMLQDISRGNRTEIAAICGEVVKRAYNYGRKAPYNQLWLKLLQQAEKNKSGSSGQPLHTISELMQRTRNLNR